MSENKTKPSEVSVEEFIHNSDSKKVADSLKLVEIMERLSGEKAAMWGASIVGFGKYHYRYESGREGDMCRIGFSPRKSAFSLYVLHCDDAQNNLLTKLGKIKMGKATCIYFKKLDDLNLEILEQLITGSLEKTKKLYG